MIVDYQMPEMTGEDFIKIVKTHADYKDIPVILYSSVESDQLRLNLKSYGVEGFLTKPARYTELLRTISKVMAGSRPIKNRPPASSLTGTLDTAASVKKSVKSAGLDILIAEDNEVNQMFIKYIMEDMDVDFKIVPNGKLAFQTWKQFSPKLVLMDISMPDWNGYEATQAIRECETSESREHTPIIAVTAHALTTDKEKCLEAGMDDYISKPISIVKLKAHIEKWTDINTSIQTSVA